MSQIVINFLNKLNIRYSLHTHPPVFTCLQLQNFTSNINSARTKNLLVRTDKKDRYFLVILECSKRADLKRLADQLHVRRLSFASPEDLMRLLGVTPGSVSPFGLLNDTNHTVSVVIDLELTQKSFLSFHPNDNTATLEMSQADFFKFLKHTSHPHQIISL